MIHRLQRLPGNTRAFTLTELAIILGVVGVMLSGIWVAASAVHQNMQVSRTESQVQEIISNFKTVYNSHHPVDTAGVTDITAFAIHSHFIPTDMLPASSTATTAVSVWGGSVSLQADPTNNKIQIAFSGVPQAVCVNLSVLLGATPDLLWQTIAGDGSSATGNTNGNWQPPVNPSGVPFTAHQAATLCTTAYTNYVAVAYMMK